MSHFIEYCSDCYAVISQCRCMDCNKTIKWGQCSKCKRMEELGIGPEDLVNDISYPQER